MTSGQKLTPMQQKVPQPFEKTGVPPVGSVVVSHSPANRKHARKRVIVKEQGGWPMVENHASTMKRREERLDGALASEQTQPEVNVAAASETDVDDRDLQDLVSYLNLKL